MNLILIIWFVIAVKILQFSDEWGTKIQLNSPGYLANKRQHRFCGLAILELAQALHSFWHKSKVCTVSITLQKLMRCITNLTQKRSQVQTTLELTIHFAGETSTIYLLSGDRSLRWLSNSVPFLQSFSCYEF